jgi:hypothetical protein
MHSFGTKKTTGLKYKILEMGSMFSIHGRGVPNVAAWVQSQIMWDMW